MTRVRVFLLAVLLPTGFVLSAAGAEAVKETDPAIAWLSDYRKGMAKAGEQRKLVLIWFFDKRLAAENGAFEKAVLQQPSNVEAICQRFVAIRLPTDVKVVVAEKQMPLLAHPAFAEMRSLPGLCVLDMTDPESFVHRQVVSVVPFEREYVSSEDVATLLDLPQGTLTQRTLIFAVRTHPERPASASCRYSQLLAHEATSHSRHQAVLGIQGHHQWDTRFHAINARLPAGLVAQEVCAESWPGQSLIDAARECVHSWRQSPGHWDAVRSRHVFFGYDMQRGRNGIWYATGIFAQELRLATR